MKGAFLFIYIFKRKINQWEYLASFRKRKKKVSTKA